MIKFDYYCSSCSLIKSNDEMDSFECPCGGQMKLLKNVEVSSFEPFYSRQLKSWITSPKQEDRILAKKGYAYLDDYKSMKRDAEYIRKHKEEYTKSEYEKVGVRYKPNSNTIFDEKRGEFIERNGQRRKKVMIVVTILLCLLTSQALADFHGSEMATVNIKGREITFPIGNDTRKQEIYYLKKALKGDQEAREMFLGGNEEKLFPVGQETPLWIKVTMDTEEIIEPNAF